MLTAAVAFSLSAAVAVFPRTAYAAAGVAATVVAIVGAASWVAVVALAVAVAVVACVDGAGTAPTAPDYLLRADVGEVVDAVPASARSVGSTMVVFAAASVDGVDVEAELDRLLASIIKANASRHRARVAALWARYIALRLANDRV